MLTTRYILFFTLVTASLTFNACTLNNQYSVKFILYPVKKGDTLNSISKKFLVSSARLRDENNLYSGAELEIGDLIRVPYYGQRVAGVSIAPNYQEAKTAKASVSKPTSSKGVNQNLEVIELGAAKIHLNKLIWPVKNAELVSRFGRRWFSFHEGIDLAAVTGTPIHAAHSGQVVYSGDGLRGYGNLVVLKGQAILTVYGHNSVNLVDVGDRVESGQVIARVGATGKAQGPHLHFETRIKNKKGLNTAVDPLVFYQKKN